MVCNRYRYRVSKTAVGCALLAAAGRAGAHSSDQSRSPRSCQTIWGFTMKMRLQLMRWMTVSLDYAQVKPSR